MRLIAGALGAVAMAVAVPTAASAKTSCGAGQKSATIGGKRMCIGVGSSCSEAMNSQYEKYGYLCEYKRGKYRIERRPTGDEHSY